MGGTTIQRRSRDRDRELRRSVGDELRRLRDDAGITRAAVADAAGIDRSYLPLIEEGRRDASNHVLAAVAAVLGAEVSIRVFATTGPRIQTARRPRWKKPS
jgi:transcriptional regulator with XRE-family HTH domain